MPKIHGWAYDVETGLLQKLKIDFKVCLRCLRVLCNNFCCGCFSRRMIVTSTVHFSRHTHACLKRSPAVRWV